MRRILSLVAGAVQAKSAVFAAGPAQRSLAIFSKAWGSCALGKRRRQGKHEHDLIVFLFDIASVAAEFPENEVSHTTSFYLL